MYLLLYIAWFTFFFRFARTIFNDIVEPELDQVQSGFRESRSTQDNVFTIKQRIEYGRTKNSET